MSVKTHTAYTYEHGEDVFDIPFDPQNDAENVFISEDGLKAVLAFLVRDEDAADPFEEFDEGEFYQFNSRYKHDAPRPDLEEFKRIVRRNPGRVFTVDSCGDGYSVGELVTAADCRGKRGTHGEECRAADLLEDADGYYIVPDDATDKPKYAKGAIEQYSNYCEGDVWGICVWTYTRDSIDEPWENPDRDEVWGFYGHDEYTLDELTTVFNHHKGV